MFHLSKTKVILSLLLWVLLIGFILLLPWLPLAVEKEISTTFLDETTANKAIVFFGFRGCDDTCPTTLMVLANLVRTETRSAEQQTSVTEEINNNTVKINSLSAEFLRESETSAEQSSALEQQALAMNILLKDFTLR
ncbi:MAG: hypothetical protein MJK12_04300 [Colwellia sp.]|nr:hypothetical protein [Colwellia sp.]